MREPSGAHLEPGLLLDLHEGRLDPAAAARVQSHLQTCPGCRAELALARSFTETPSDAPIDALAAARIRNALTPPLSAAPAAVPIGARAERRPFFRLDSWLVRGFALAASLALVVIGVRTFRPSDESPSGVMRTKDPGPAWSVAAAAQTDGWTISWNPIDEASTYRVIVLSLPGTPVAEIDGAAAGTPLPLSVIPAEHRGSPLFVRIAAVRASGKRVESPAVELPALENRGARAP